MDKCIFINEEDSYNSSFNLFKYSSIVPNLRIISKSLNTVSSNSLPYKSTYISLTSGDNVSKDSFGKVYGDFLYSTVCLYFLIIFKAYGKL